MKDEARELSGSRAILSYQKRCSSKLFTASYAQKKGHFKNVAFMPGCALASYSPALIKTIYGHLERQLPGLGIIQQCCAKPALYLGERKLFYTYYNKLTNELKHKGLDTIITACENCYMTLRRFSPELEIRSLYQVLLETGIPERDYSKMPTAALHDPCPTRREFDLQESVRALLNLMHYPFEEFQRNRKNTVCCGRGGMLELRNPVKARECMRRRCSESKSSFIISYCQSCVEALAKGGAHTWNILDLIFNEDFSSHFSQPQQGVIWRWLNRYRSKKVVELAARRDLK